MMPQDTKTRPKSESDSDATSNDTTCNKLLTPQSVTVAIILLAALYAGRGFVLPVLAALILSYALIPLVRVLCRCKVPRIVASFLVVSGFSAACVFGAITLSGPALNWLEKAPRSFEKLEHLLETVQQPVNNMSRASEQLNEMTNGEKKRGEVVVRVKESSLAKVFLSQTPAALGATTSTLILMFFLLTFGKTLLRRVVEISPRLRDKVKAVETAREIESNVSRYLTTVTLINSCLGLSVGLSLYFLGFESPALWGTLAACLNFVPYLGAIAGVLLLALASLSVTPDPLQALLFPSVYLALTLIEGNFITPVILGKSFELNPVFIILVLLFLGWMWGILGAVMAVPLLVAIKSAASHFPKTQNVATLISR